MTKKQVLKAKHSNAMLYSSSLLLMAGTSLMLTGKPTSVHASDINDSKNRSLIQSDTNLSSVGKVAGMSITQDTSVQGDKLAKSVAPVDTSATTDYTWKGKNGESLTIKLSENGTLTLPAGEITDARLLIEPLGADKLSVKTINIAGPLKINGDASYLFSRLKNTISINGLDRLNTSNVTSMNSMFSGMTSLTSLDVSNFDTSNVTDMTAMFSGMTSLTSLDVSKIDTSKVTRMDMMFYGMSALTTLDVSHFDTSKVTRMQYMFSGMSSLTSLDGVDKFNTSNVIYMSEMFSVMESLSALDVSNFDTSNVTDMSAMFSGMTSLTSLDVSKIDTSKVTRMDMMFYGMSALTTLDVSNFDTSNVTDMAGMFSSMESLPSLDVSNFDTSNVTEMNNMFSVMSSLTSLKGLDKFKTSNVTDMQNMFNGVSALTTLDISEFDTSNVTNMLGMFESDNNLSTLKLGAKTKLTNEVSLPNISSADAYSGKWINVGNGTVVKPTGTNIWSSDELMTNYNGATDADTYVWQRALSTINIKYVDEAGKEIKQADTATGSYGDDYEYSTSDAPAIEGYTLSKIENANGTFGDADSAKPVTYVYTLNSVDKAVKYVDENGKTIKADTTITGKYGTDYNYTVADAPKVDGYTIKAIDNGVGKYSDNKTPITYTYTQNDAKLTINYLDDKTKKPIKESQVINGKYGDKYTFDAKDHSVVDYQFINADKSQITLSDTKENVINVYYTHETATIKFHYYDEDNNKIQDDKFLTGDTNTPFNYTVDDADGIVGYKIIGVRKGEDVIGPYGNDVDFVYEKIDIDSGISTDYLGLTTKYVDSEGNEIAKSTVDSVLNGDTYTTKSASIKGYHLVKTPDNSTGTMSDPTIVVYTYEKDDSKGVLVNYVDEAGNKLADSDTLSGKVGDSYKTTAKDIAHYTLVKTPTNDTGKYVDDLTTVNYVYKVNKAKMTINYLDNSTKKPIKESTVVNGVYGDKYSFNEKDYQVKDYDFINSDKSNVALDDKKDTVVNIYYTHKTGSITFKYVDENGNSIQSDKISKFDTNTAYNYTVNNADSILGYTVQSVNNGVGNVSEDGNTITFVYKSIDVDGDISTDYLGLTTKYVDSEGKELAKPTSQSILNGDKYTTTAPKIDGYHLEVVPTNASGTMTDPTTVSYIYVKNDSKGILVNYVDDKGNQLATSDVSYGKVGDSYTTTAKSINGYELVATPTNASGKYTDDLTTINYVYKAIEKGTITVNYVDKSTGKILDTKTITGNIGDAYSTERQDLEHYTLVDSPDNANGLIVDGTTVNYQYTPNKAKVNIHYIDEDGNSILSDVVMNGFYGNQYSVDENDAPKIIGYTLKAVDNNTGTYDDMVEGNITMTYVKDKEVPTVPTEPETPTTPTTPETPSPEEPSVVEPTKPTVPTNTTDTGDKQTVNESTDTVNVPITQDSNEDKSTSNPVDNNDSDKLVKTDSHANNNLTIIGLFMGILGLLGLGKTKKKNKEI